ncbi:putative glycosyl transferase (group 2 family protein) [Desulforapulum autotrophicum HRM2]|uniref:Glycosyl transferase (Group 2 family protein) n=1 Tax=Desulforapulum autotrophicum (strain ATCC 43914 / DSM 3382 / VKM B-1955 / HRM2) TaxID=177437 RepID=C0QK41_DESAH|nr:glycosyltransferase family 2 protein [Desulforapulum autotrophicum]ACN16067.1 putative glycosyl transferase (group 2 family protein) [Desulforapulum autotrophicum HRM2]
MKIICVIVTYNRLLLLKTAIQAVLNQTRPVDEIIVVDNLSKDGTRAYLKNLENDRIRPRLLDENSGGAGGFYHGIKQAFEEGADWIWIMDDDSLPKDDALERLITCPVFKAKEQEIGFLASRVNWTDGNKCIMNSPLPNQVYWDWYLTDHNGCFQIDRCSFVSMLINRKAIQRLGYPVKEFFIWLDDWEYSGRITAHFPGFYIPDSQVIHQLPENKGVDYADITDQNLWKFLYEARNQVAYLTYQSGLGIFDALLFLVRRIILMNRLKKSFAQQFKILYSGLQGFFFNYKKRIEIPESRDH